MPTAQQLSRGARKFKHYSLSRSHSAFIGAPMRRGTIYKIAIITPRKPNSAKRTIAKVRLKVNERRVFAKIPGQGDHFLQAHSVVMVRGHGPKDTPGVNYHLIRGLYDFERVEIFGRRNRRSKFGMKQPLAKSINLGQ
jgi:small subunit ribosomal protein S12